MKKTWILSFVLILILPFAQAQSSKNTVVSLSFIERVLNGLAADDMRGRHAFSPEADKAADFIANEFKTIGLDKFVDGSYYQSFMMYKVARVKESIVFNNSPLKKEEFLILGNAKHVNWNNTSNIKKIRIRKSDDFSKEFRALVQSNENMIVEVDPAFSSYISRLNKIYGKETVIPKEVKEASSKVFIICKSLPDNFDIDYQSKITPFEMRNVIGAIPGKSKPQEYVIFSGHYDHIGVLEPIDNDSIANGADDDASGITAIISLAKYYKEKNNNARTLLFVAFTAEEMGMFGSKFFSNNIPADSVVAMINIEMIGKESKFGRHSLYITGFDRSDLGKIMQENVKGSNFIFHPDPYPTQNLFYRSDNAVLAALGVPAHTFSTSQIDKDTYYHTVKDEVSTLDLENIQLSIEAIAIGAEGFVNGIQTPSRVEKLKD